MQHRVVIFEVEGGSDKWFDGHRKDSVPIVESLHRQGWDAEVLYYRPEWAQQLIEYVGRRADGYVSRVNPGNVPGGEGPYFAMLRGLSELGLVGMSHPDEMVTLGAKDVLVKLAGTDLVPADTYAYYDVDTFRNTFPTSLSYGQRVLKQNRGSTGEGIWRVRLADPDRRPEPGAPLPLDTALRCTEAVDNHTEERTLGEFMDFCHQYIVGDNGMLVDMRFMPRIVEGEIRILLVGAQPVFVVHKKPAETEDAFSATLFSGAKYRYDSPDRWPDLIELFHRELPRVHEKLNVSANPLIWTADFMLDTAEDGGDTYVLGEINCSCVGFTSQLDMGIQEKVAAEIIRQVTERDALDELRRSKRYGRRELATV